MHINLKIDYDMLDDITRQNLVDMHQSVMEELNSLKRIMRDRGLKLYEASDLQDAKKNSKALRRIIRYISTEEQYKELNL